MNDLYLTPVGMEQRQDPYELIIPESFEEALTYEEQILWLLAHKQDLLVEGDNITLTPNEDGTVTISSEASGATYTIETATPDAGYTAAYILKNVDTGQQAGAKIQVPTVAGPQGPQGPQGETGPAGPAGNGISSITSQHIAGQSRDIRSKIPSASNPMDPSPWGEGSHSMADGTHYVVVGVNNSQTIYTSHLTVGDTIYDYTVNLMPIDNDETYVEFTLNGFASVVKLISGVYPFDDFTTESLVLRDSQNNEVARYYLRDYVDQSWVMEFTNVPAGTYTIHLENAQTHPDLSVQVWGLRVPTANGFTQVTVNYTNGGSATFNVPDGATGPQGATGPAGPGVPTGGTAGQVLKKSGSGDYETNWEDPSGGLPTGGTTGQVLRKVSNTDNDVAWQTLLPNLTGSANDQNKVVMVNSTRDGYTTISAGTQTSHSLVSSVTSFPATGNNHQLKNLKTVNNDDRSQNRRLSMYYTSFPRTSGASIVLTEAICTLIGTLTVGTAIPIPSNYSQLYSNRYSYDTTDSIVYVTGSTIGNYISNIGYGYDVINAVVPATLKNSTSGDIYHVQVIVMLLDSTASNDRKFRMRLVPLTEAIPAGDYEFTMMK